MNYSHFVGLDVGKKTFDASLMSRRRKELSHKSLITLNWDPIFIGLDS